MTENEDKLIFDSSPIELAEFKTYIELKSRLCWYGYPNANGVMLPIEGAKEKAQTLVCQPVVAYYKKDYIGRDDLGGHQLTIDKNGEAHYGTESVGVNTEVSVADDTVNINGEERTLPCLFATRRIWTRHKKYVAAIKRLYKAKRLTSSWEILVGSYHFEDGIKILDDYAFDADALLGSQVTPAFSCATTLSVASEDKSEISLAQALADDIKFNKEDKQLEENVSKPLADTVEINTNDIVEAKDKLIIEKDNIIAEKDNELAQKNTALAAANERIQILETEIAALIPYKDEHEKSERERIEAENAAKRAALTDKLNKSKLFNEAEIASKEIQKLISDMNESEIMNKIAEKFMASLEADEIRTEQSEVAENHKNNTAYEKANLDDDMSVKGAFSIIEMLKIRN